MGRSGNPAKAARQATYEEIRDVIVSGKTAKFRPLPHTEVTVRSTDADEAELVVRNLDFADLDPDGYDDVYLVNLQVLFAWVHHNRPKKAMQWLKGINADVEAEQANG